MDQFGDVRAATVDGITDRINAGRRSSGLLVAYDVLGADGIRLLVSSM
jgi:hypothetical protein